MTAFGVLFRQEIRRALGVWPIRLLYVTIAIGLVWFIRPAFDYALAASSTGPAAEQTAVGQICLWGVLSLVFLGYTVNDDITNHVSERLRMTGLGWGSILGSKVLVAFVSQVVSAVVVYVLAAVVFGIDLFTDPLPRLLLVVAFSFTLTMLGWMLVAICPTSSAFTVACYGAGLLLPASAGGLAPYSMLAGWAQRTGRVFPSYWFFRAVDHVADGTATLGATMTDVGVILLFGVGYGAAGLLCFRPERRLRRLAD